MEDHFNQKVLSTDRECVNQGMKGLLGKKDDCDTMLASTLHLNRFNY
jgi:hypothetical protein